VERISELRQQIETSKGSHSWMSPLRTTCTRWWDSNNSSRMVRPRSITRIPRRSPDKCGHREQGGANDKITPQSAYVDAPITKACELKLNRSGEGIKCLCWVSNVRG
jgi:hypothetical protein